MGMYTACQEELVRALKAAGCEKEPFLTMKRLQNSAESRISAVLCEEEQLERNAGRKYYTADGNSHKRAKIFDRNIVYTVIIGDFTQDKAEETYENFLLALVRGIYVDGNYVAIEPSEAQWMGEKDYILNAKVVVQVKITCSGGLYRDTDMAKISDIKTDVKKE